MGVGYTVLRGQVRPHDEQLAENDVQSFRVCAEVMGIWASGASYIIRHEKGDVM